MQPSSFFLALLATSSSLCSLLERREDVASNTTDEINEFQPTDALAQLASQGLDHIQELQVSGLKSRGRTCSLRDVVIRRNWDHLSPDDRTSYINAVLCLMNRPSLLNQEQYPGAKSRYDDFVAVHINQTLSIHGTGNFLGWHRYFVFTYEQTLRNECGYKGYQPYWNWGTNAANPSKSPVFDGSATSLSGNGAFLLHNGSLAGTGNIFLPSEQGGGCVTSGPFKNMLVNLGPVSPAQDGVVKSSSNFAYNPRCLKRDLSTKASSTWLKMSNILSLILKSPDILTFQNTMQGDFPAGFLGVHAAGHFTMNGDPGGDLFASPGDPAFWLHHAMIDRTWWIWQTLNLPGSLTDVAGTLTIFNTPPSANTTLLDLQNLGPLAGNIPLGDLLNTMSGPLCYIYL
ncbi:hypothetical protein VTL71DRAFT_6782 [Oculimacula yallundae]|uniref:Tyrosinase copper-binding domain-containing protein n=1 Tax=Oculimacula yallundae TaxID=86028 RepID=A0ABR4BXW4_9HELO